MAQIGNLDRPVLDQTGLGGTFDFIFEWTPQHNAYATAGPNAQAEASRQKFLDDLKAQLGLKLVAQDGAADIFVIDHVEQPLEN
jgi:uncharacterized protein (TIGR03435 family)